MFKQEVVHAFFFDLTEKKARKFASSLGSEIYKYFLKQGDLTFTCKAELSDQELLQLKSINFKRHRFVWKLFNKAEKICYVSNNEEIIIAWA